MDLKTTAVNLLTIFILGLFLTSQSVSGATDNILYGANAYGSRQDVVKINFTQG